MIGALDQRIAGASINRVEGHADARRDHQRVLGEQQGFRDLGTDFLGDCFGVFANADVRQKNHEFVAAESTRGIASAYRCERAPRGLAQNLVACGMAVPIVDGLEPIEVEQQDGDLTVFAMGLENGQIETVGKQGAIGKSGERVVQCEAARIDQFFRERPRLMLKLAICFNKLADLMPSRLNVGAAGLQRRI